MNEKGNLIFKNALLIGFLVAISLVLYVYIIQQVKVLAKVKRERVEILNEKTNSFGAKLVEIQKLSSEERIVRIASSSLDLERTSKPFDLIRINKKQVERIENLVNSKYD